MADKVPKLRPFNDYALVEVLDIKAEGLELQRGEHDSVQCGRVIEIGSSPYLSTNAWVLELPQELNTGNLSYFKELVGKVIYWEKFTDNNATVDHDDGKKYAFIKLSKIVGYQE